MINIDEIKTFTKDELFDTEKILEIFDFDKGTRLQYTAFLSMRAGELRCRRAFDKFMNELINEYDEENEKVRQCTTINDFVEIMRADIYFSGVRYNEFTKMPEITQPGEEKTRAWTDFDDSLAKNYIEMNYNKKGEKKYIDAFNVLMTERRYNPIKNAVEATKWDGTDRIETFLIKWLKCEDTAYTRELSRLIFAGGIHRAYDPGCKFDDVVVLVGKQGCGKSTFIRWLAMNDELYGEINTIEGKEAKENLLGIWIGELGELLAVTKAKECEAVKAFLSCKSDRFRPSYGRRTDNFPRQCIFIGSTNKMQFLTDKTGNRRMFPVVVKCTSQYIYAHKDELQAEIKQCWAEALAKINTDFMIPSENKDIIGDIEAEQKRYMEEDYREGMISAYLETKDKVCLAELWEHALNCELPKMTRKDSNDLALIMQSMDDWESEKPTRFGKYGVQRLWRKKPGMIELKNDEENPF